MIPPGTLSGMSPIKKPVRISSTSVARSNLPAGTNLLRTERVRISIWALWRSGEAGWKDSSSRTERIQEFRAHQDFVGSDQGPQKAGPVKRTPGRLPRVPFTPGQLSALEDAYKMSTYLSSEEANQLAYSLDLTNTRVKIWFQNRRARDRREKREAILGTTTTTNGGAGALTLTTAAAALAPVGHFAYFSGQCEFAPGSPPTGSSGTDRKNPM